MQANRSINKTEIREEGWAGVEGHIIRQRPHRKISASSDVLQ